MTNRKYLFLWETKRLQSVIKTVFKIIIPWIARKEILLTKKVYIRIKLWAKAKVKRVRFQRVVNKVWYDKFIPWWHLGSFMKNIFIFYVIEREYFSSTHTTHPVFSIVHHWVNVISLQRNTFHVVNTLTQVALYTVSMTEYPPTTSRTRHYDIKYQLFKHRKVSFGLNLQ